VDSERYRRALASEGGDELATMDDSGKRPKWPGQVLRSSGRGMRAPVETWLCERLGANILQKGRCLKGRLWMACQ